MSISIYKPTVKNSGSGFSFQMGIDSKSKEPTLFVKSILQHSWDAQKKQGYFKDNLDNPDKNITIKFSEFEIGHILYAIRTRTIYSTFHAYGTDKTSIKFSPWEKKSKKSFKNKDGQWEDQWVDVPAFSISFVRNSTQNFVIGLEPGETESVSQYLKFVLNSLFQCRFTKQTEEFKERMKKKSSKDEQPPF
tara:strand:+ start:53 stop:625 length:573 start_codon:yes stop_codon:yes gene_type:complete